jgi:hypothetical protein
MVKALNCKSCCHFRTAAEFAFDLPQMPCAS